VHCHERQIVFSIVLSRLFRFIVRPPEMALKYRR
jgi:hypothetical protein